MEVDWISGACLLVRQDVVEQIGLLDERFFLYFEDNDWCLRMRRADWRVFYDPRFEVIHLGGASLPRRSQATQIYYQSLIQFTAKHYGPVMAWVVQILLKIYRTLRNPCSSFRPKGQKCP